MYSNCQEDLSCLLFTLLYHQVSLLDYYHSVEAKAGSSSKFDLSSNLKFFIHAPFGMNEPLVDQQLNQSFEIQHLKEQQLSVFELNYKLELLLREKLETYKKERAYQGDIVHEAQPIEVRLRVILDQKFRLFWNFKWHGGSLLKLCNDLLNNEALVQNETNST